MSTPPITGWMPKVSAEPQPDEIHRHFTLIFQKLANHATGFGLLTQKINSIKPGNTTTIEQGGGGGGGSVVPFVAPSSIPVNNQSGVTAYSTVAGDDGTLIVLSDASPIAVTLSSQSPPWSCFITNQSALGGGTATLTPASGTINGAATLTILPTYGAIVCFDGTNWAALTMPVVPVNTPGVAHEWIASYNAATGAFTLSQPAFSDISGNLATSQLPTAGVSGTINLAALTGGGTTGTITVTNGLITAFVNPT